MRAMLLGSPGELGRANEKNVTNSTLCGNFTAGGLTSGTNIELVFRLAMAGTDEWSCTNHEFWEAYLD